MISYKNKKIVFYGFFILTIISLIGYKFFCWMTYKNYKFVVFIPSYNNKSWYRYNLNSVFNQKHRNYRVIYTDDASTDGTYDLARQYIDQYNLWSKVTLLHNKHNRGALYNTYRAIHMCDDDEIFVTLDGDDWFSHANVLSHLNQVYQDKNVWFTYGQFMNWPTMKRGWCMSIPQKVAETNNFRKYGFRGAALRTWRAWLAKKIKLKHLISPSKEYKGKFFPAAADVALVFPILEMCGSRFRFISQILCIRNVKSPINDFKVHRKEQCEVTEFLHKCKRYRPLSNRISKKQFSNIDLKIVSKDPIKLKKSLELIRKSKINFKDIHVFYEENEVVKERYDILNRDFKDVLFVSFKAQTFKSLFRPLVEKGSDYVLFSNDEPFLKNINLSYCIYALEKTYASVFFLDFKSKENIVLQKIDPSIRVFTFDEQILGKECLLNNVIYSRNKILKILQCTNLYSWRDFYIFLKDSLCNKICLCFKNVNKAIF